MKSFLKNIFSSLISKENDRTIFSIGSAHFSKMKKNYPDIKSLIEVDYKVFSQNGEDGIIDFLTYILNIKNIKFIEIGVGDYTECNTRFLTYNFPFQGLVCDFNEKLKSNIGTLVSTHRGNIKIFNNFINEQNIIKILEENNFNKDVNLFSLDIDGNDYFILRLLPDNFSDIFIAEYNQNFGSELEVTTPYVNNFDRFKYHYSGLCWGLSIKSLVKLMESKGYVFLGSNTECCNAFFIKKKNKYKLNENFNLNINLSECCNDFVCDARDKNGNLNKLSIRERLELVKNCEVIDLSDDNQNKKYISEILKK